VHEELESWKSCDHDHGTVCYGSCMVGLTCSGCSAGEGLFQTVSQTRLVLTASARNMQGCAQSIDTLVPPWSRTMDSLCALLDATRTCLTLVLRLSHMHDEWLRAPPASRFWRRYGRSANDGAKDDDHYSEHCPTELTDVLRVRAATTSFLSSRGSSVLFAIHWPSPPCLTALFRLHLCLSLSQAAAKTDIINTTTNPCARTPTHRLNFCAMQR
jgi:hypothetical protein